MATLAIFRSTRATLARQSFVNPQISRMELRRDLSSYLVTPKELDDAIKTSASSSTSADPRIIPLCASWFLPNNPLTGLQVFQEKRIPKSRFFDLDKVKDKHSPYPHMLPEPKQFAQAMSNLGIRKDDTVVVYDSQELGIFSAPRVAWTLRVLGHPKVHILNNFKLWAEEGYPTESGHLFTVECNPYPIPTLDETKIASFEDVYELAVSYTEQGANDVQILDARSHGRFTGESPEPREGLSSGHIPGSISIPFNEVLDPVTKTFLPKEQLRKLFEAKGVDPSRPIISSCGTGVTAAVVETALEVAGYGSAENRRVYDGSWTEWAQRVQSAENLIIKDSTTKA